MDTAVRETPHIGRRLFPVYHWIERRDCVSSKTKFLILVEIEKFAPTTACVFPAIVSAGL